MKKVLFAVALVMGLGSSVAFAGNMVSDVEIVVMVNDYKPIEVKDLPQAVQDTIKKDFADLTIKEAAVEESEGVQALYTQTGDTPRISRGAFICFSVYNAIFGLFACTEIS